jgi:hypothetical protein
MESLAKVELVLSSRSSIALTLRKPFVELDPTGKLQLTLIFQRMVNSFLRRIASIVFGLASIPFVDTRQPRNLPFFTPKTHFSGFNFKPTSLKLANVSYKLAI